jgi:hypothetical protein
MATQSPIEKDFFGFIFSNLVIVLSYFQGRTIRGFSTLYEKTKFSSELNFRESQDSMSAYRIMDEHGKITSKNAEPQVGFIEKNL